MLISLIDGFTREIGTMNTDFGKALTKSPMTSLQTKGKNVAMLMDS